MVEAKFVNIIYENQDVENVGVMHFVNIIDKKIFVENVVGVKFVNIIEKNHIVKNVKEVASVNIINEKRHVKSVRGAKFVNTINLNQYVKNVMVVRFVNIIELNHIVKNVTEAEFSGSGLCKSPWCETAKNPKYEGYCLSCFVNLFPDRPNTKNYKTKEKATAEYVLERFPEFTWVTDKQIQDGCSRKRPDLLLDLGYQVIVTEIDENQHESYDCSCENKRLMLLSQDVGHRPMVFIRFNPDDYLSGDTKVTSCWANNKLGVCTVKKTKVKEWNERLEALISQITYWSHLENKTEKTVEIVQLFYDCA